MNQNKDSLDQNFNQVHIPNSLNNIYPCPFIPKYGAPSVPLSSFKAGSEKYACKSIKSSFANHDDRGWSNHANGKLLIHRYDGGDDVLVQKSMHMIPYTANIEQLKKYRRESNVKFLYN